MFTHHYEVRMRGNPLVVDKLSAIQLERGCYNKLTPGTVKKDPTTPTRKPVFVGSPFLKIILSPLLYTALYFDEQQTIELQRHKNLPRST